MTAVRQQVRSAEDNIPKRIVCEFARSHPVPVFLFLTFSWSWLIWFSAIPLSAGQDKPLMMALTFIGGYGPAVAGILTLSLMDGFTKGLSARRAISFGIAFVSILTVMALRYIAGSLPHYDELPNQARLSIPVVVLVLLACCTGAWAISSARSDNPSVRARMASLFPAKLPLGWLGFALLFNAFLCLISWGVGYLLNLGTVKPPLWQRSAPEAVFLFVLTFLMTALVRGGMEEPGWRGLMLPELQKARSPLMASLIIAVFWDLWHVPLHLNGFYREGVVAGMLQRSTYIIPLSILFTWLYNRTGGCLFLLVCFHTTFNVVGGFVPSAPSPLAIIALTFVVLVVFKDRMYRKLESAMRNSVIRPQASE